MCVQTHEGIPFSCHRHTHRHRPTDRETCDIRQIRCASACVYRHSHSPPALGAEKEGDYAVPFLTGKQIAGQAENIDWFSDLITQRTARPQDGTLREDFRARDLTDCVNEEEKRQAASSQPHAHTYQGNDGVIRVLVSWRRDVHQCVSPVTSARTHTHTHT